MIAAKLFSGFESSPNGLGQQHKKAAIFQRYFGCVLIKREGVDTRHVFCAYELNALRRLHVSQLHHHIKKKQNNWMGVC